LTKLRLVPYRTFVNVVESQGYVWNRCVGSHNTFKHADGRTITVPNHGNETLKRGLVAKLVRQMGLAINDYNQLLDSL
jgi:predicted RNA binding protein YcfA (HicA-like mRNA interferase family)